MTYEIPNVNLLKNRTGLDTQQIKVEHSINELVGLLRNTRSDKKRKYLVNEINFWKSRLKLLKNPVPV